MNFYLQCKCNISGSAVQYLPQWSPIVRTSTAKSQLVFHYQARRHWSIDHLSALLYLNTAMISFVLEEMVVMDKPQMFYKRRISLDLYTHFTLITHWVWRIHLVSSLFNKVCFSSKYTKTNHLSVYILVAYFSVPGRENSYFLKNRSRY